MKETKTPLTIREAVPDDVESIVHFNQCMAQETEGKQLDGDRLRRGVATALARNDLCRYFLAVEDHRVVGQAMITYEWSDWRNGTFWWLQSVYVDAAHRRRGTFRAIHQHVKRLARSSPGVCGLRLYVERENQRAQAAYRRLEMSDAGYLVYEEDWSGAV